MKIFNIVRYIFESLLFCAVVFLLGKQVIANHDAALISRVNSDILNRIVTKSKQDGELKINYMEGSENRELVLTIKK